MRRISNCTNEKQMRVPNNKLTLGSGYKLCPHCLQRIILSSLHILRYGYQKLFFEMQFAFSRFQFTFVKRVISTIFLIAFVDCITGSITADNTMKYSLILLLVALCQVSALFPKLRLPAKLGSKFSNVVSPCVIALDQR